MVEASQPVNEPKPDHDDDFDIWGSPEKDVPVEAQEDLGVEAVEDSVDGPYGSFESRDEKDRERLRTLFQPFSRPDVPRFEDGGYDYLFEQDVAKQQKMIQDEEKRRSEHESKYGRELGVARDYDKFVTDASREAAVGAAIFARQHDETLDGIFNSHGFRSSSQEAVDALREADPQLRLEVADYLLDKLDALIKKNPHAMPDRVYINRQKRPDARNIPVNYMTSREYVVMLAMSILDGSFNEGQTSSGDKPGTTTGQHRYAAQTLLEASSV